MNRKGFSLIEVLVALGLMGVASIFMMKLRQSQSKAQKTSENQAFIFQTFTEIRAYMQKPGVCFKSLENQKIASQVSLNSIKRNDGSDKYKVGEKLSGGSFKISKIWFENVTSTFVAGPDSDYRGEAMLNFQFEKTNKESFGAASIIKSMEIDFVTKNSGELKNCAALGFLVVPKSIEIKEDNVENSESSEAIVENTTTTLVESQKDDTNSAFSNAVEDAAKITGKNISQEQINKAIKKNPQLGEMMNMLKRVEESNRKAQQALEEN